MKFKSKIDGWGHLLMIVLLAETVLMLYLTAVNQSPVYFAISILLLVLAVIAVPVYAVTWFVMEDTELVIHSGLIYHKRIPYTVITRAVKTSDMAVSIAFSLSRLDFHFRERGIMKKLLIAPVDRELFQRMLLLKNPLIQIDDNQPRAYDIKEVLKNKLELNPKGKVPNNCKDKTETE